MTEDEIKKEVAYQIWLHTPLGKISEMNMAPKLNVKSRYALKDPEETMNRRKSLVRFMKDGKVTLKLSHQNASKENSWIGKLIIFPHVEEGEMDYILDILKVGATFDTLHSGWEPYFQGEQVVWDVYKGIEIEYVQPPNGALSGWLVTFSFKEYQRNETDPLTEGKIEMIPYSTWPPDENNEEKNPEKLDSGVPVPVSEYRGGRMGSNDWERGESLSKFWSPEEKAKLPTLNPTNEIPMPQGFRNPPLPTSDQGLNARAQKPGFWDENKVGGAKVDGPTGLRGYPGLVGEPYIPNESNPYNGIQQVRQTTSNRDTFVQSLQTNIDRCMDIIRAKTQDYATMEDPYKNFRMSEQLGVSVEQGIIIRIGDKISRIANLVKSGNGPAVKDETIEDSILDGMNYLNILLTYIQSQKKENTASYAIPKGDIESLFNPTSR